MDKINERMPPRKDGPPTPQGSGEEGSARGPLPHGVNSSWGLPSSCLRASPKECSIALWDRLSLLQKAHPLFRVWFNMLWDSCRWSVPLNSDYPILRFGCLIHMTCGPPGELMRCLAAAKFVMSIILFTVVLRCLVLYGS